METTVNENVEITDLNNCVNIKHRIIRMRVTGLTAKNPEIVLEAGQLKLNRIVLLTVTPIGLSFGAVWNGSSSKPAIRFDGWPGESFDLVLDAWGN